MNNQSLLFDIKKVDSLISAFDANMPLSDEDILLIIDAAWKEYIPALQSYVILNPLRAIEILIEITKRPNVNLQALRMLGKCYLDGNIVEQNTEWGLRYYQMAVNREDSKAMLKLGCIYDKGLYGVPVDENKACDLYVRSIKQGNNDGLVYLGWFMQKHEEYSFGSEFVVSLYRKSIERKANLDVAYLNLGKCYYDGYGVERDFDEAAECFEKAIEYGDTDLAYSNLVIVYTNKYNPHRSLGLAQIYLNKGIQAGSLDCQRLKDKIKKCLEEKKNAPCLTCLHRMSNDDGTYGCIAFKDLKIPEEIIRGENDHTKVLEGQRLNLTYESTIRPRMHLQFVSVEAYNQHWSPCSYCKHFKNEECPAFEDIPMSLIKLTGHKKILLGQNQSDVVFERK